MLVARFRRVEWRTDTPDVHARVISLLLELSRNPLRTKYTHIDAMAALGEDDLGTNDDDGASDRDQASDRDEPDEPVDDATSDSTLSDWTDDEEEDGDDDARAERLRLGVEEAVAARRDAPRGGEWVRGRRSGAPADGTDDDGDGDDGDEKSAPGDGDDAATDPEFRWSDLRVDDEPASSSRRDRDEWEWDPRTTRRPSRGGAGDAVVAAAARLLNALASARGREGATLVDAWDRRTESKVVGDALHALQGAAPARRAPGRCAAPVARRAAAGLSARRTRLRWTWWSARRTRRSRRPRPCCRGGRLDRRPIRSHDSRLRRGSPKARPRAAGGAGAPRAEGGGVRR